MLGIIFLIGIAIPDQGAIMKKSDTVLLGPGAISMNTMITSWKHLLQQLLSDFK